MLASFYNFTHEYNSHLQFIKANTSGATSCHLVSFTTQFSKTQFVTRGNEPDYGCTVLPRSFYSYTPTGKEDAVTLRHKPDERHHGQRHTTTCLANDAICSSGEGLQIVPCNFCSIPSHVSLEVENTKTPVLTSSSFVPFIQDIHN
jgi:hypothetical protein